MKHDHLASRRPALFLVAGVALAATSILLAALGDPPYLSLGDFSPWLAVFAVGLFLALFAVPFLIHRRLRGALEEDARWERALLGWGAVALALGAGGVLLGLPSGFASSSLAGSVAVVCIAEASLVLGTLVAWLLAG